MKQVRVGILILAIGLTLSGCFWVTTKAEGRKTQRQVDDIDSRLKKQEKGIDKKMKSLQVVLDKATALLAKNSANIGDDLKGLEAELRELRGILSTAKRMTEEVKTEIAELKKLETGLAGLEQRLAALEKKPVAKPKSAAELYRDGKRAFDGGEYGKARALFKELVARFPGHSRADDGQYFRGESHFREGDYDAAIREFQKLFDGFAGSSMKDDAWYRAGEAAVKLKQCTEARAYFGELRRRHPKSSLAKKASKKIRELKKAASNSRKCLK